MAATRKEPLSGLTVRPMERRDLPEADRIFRLAFATFLGIPDPEKAFGDADFIASRWTSDPEAAFVAQLDGQLVGSNMVTIWGSMGFFGPLTVRPDLWDRGVAHALLAPTMQLFERRGVGLRGLYTFAQSNKHVRLYQRYGFWPRFLNVTFVAPVNPELAGATPIRVGDGLEQNLAAIRELSEAVYPGLDPTREARSVLEQGIGSPVLVYDNKQLVGYAICHGGKGSEAGTSGAYVKFAAVRPGPNSLGWFQQLLDSCLSHAATAGAKTLRCGIHTARLRAYQALLARGWPTEMLGISMLSPGTAAGYDSPDRIILEDWR
jgi:ribosomal protein S18 acetylase RimI-like enzyme